MYFFFLKRKKSYHFLISKSFVVHLCFFSNMQSENLWAQHKHDVWLKSNSEDTYLPRSSVCACAHSHTSIVLHTCMLQPAISVPRYMCTHSVFCTHTHAHINKKIKSYKPTSLTSSPISFSSLLLLHPGSNFTQWQKLPPFLKACVWRNH